MTISFGSTYLLNLNQKLHKNLKKDNFKRERFINIIEERLPQNYILSEQKDFLCISVKEKADESVDNIIKKYGYKKFKKSGKHNLVKNDMSQMLKEYMKITK